METSMSSNKYSRRNTCTGMYYSPFYLQLTGSGLVGLPGAAAPNPAAEAVAIETARARSLHLHMEERRVPGHLETPKPVTHTNVRVSILTYMHASHKCYL